MYGAVRGTYEPAQTRAFLCGRTECIRTVSSESKAWVEAMRNAKSNVRRGLANFLLACAWRARSRDGRLYGHAPVYHQPVERTELLRAAINKHVARSKLASRGEGVDRHLFGAYGCLCSGSVAARVHVGGAALTPDVDGLWRLEPRRSAHVA